MPEIPGPILGGDVQSFFILLENNFDDSEKNFQVSVKWHRPFTK